MRYTDARAILSEAIEELDEVNRGLYSMTKAERAKLWGGKDFVDRSRVGGWRDSTQNINSNYPSWTIDGRPIKGQKTPQWTNNYWNPNWGGPISTPAIWPSDNQQLLRSRFPNATDSKEKLSKKKTAYKPAVYGGKHFIPSNPNFASSTIATTISEGLLLKYDGYN